MSISTNLYNRSILIGKEPTQGRLLISILLNGVPKTAGMGLPGSVPNYVSRCIPANGVAHCCIDVNGEGKMLLTNMKEQNVTYVNGTEIESKFINASDRVELGSGRYMLDVPGVLDLSAKLVKKVVGAAPPPPPKEYNIDHLHAIQEAYNKGNDDIERSQNLNTVLMRIPAIISALLGTITAIAKSKDMTSLGNLSLAGTVVGMLVLLFGLYRTVSKPAGKQRRALQDKFKKEYMCPHKECSRTLKSYDFDELTKMKKCPYCGSIFKTTL